MTKMTIATRGAKGLNAAEVLFLTPDDNGAPSIPAPTGEAFKDYLDGPRDAALGAAEAAQDVVDQQAATLTEVESARSQANDDAAAADASRIAAVAAANGAAGAVSGAAITAATKTALDAITVDPVGGGAIPEGRLGVAYSGSEAGQYRRLSGVWAYEGPLNGELLATFRRGLSVPAETIGVGELGGSLLAFNSPYSGITNWDRFGRMITRLEGLVSTAELIVAISQANAAKEAAAANSDLSATARIGSEAAAAAAAGAVSGATISRATLAALQAVTVDPSTGLPIAEGRTGEVFNQPNAGQYRFRSGAWAFEGVLRTALAADLAAAVTIPVVRPTAAELALPYFRLDLTIPGLTQFDPLGRCITHVEGLPSAATGGDGADTGFSTEFIRAFDSRALAARALAYGPRLDSATLRYRLDLSVSLGMGQSFIIASQGGPAQTRTVDASRNCKMLGNGPVPAASFDGIYTPVGGATLQPLASRDQGGTDSHLLSDAEVAAQVPGNDAESGENMMVASTYFTRAAWEQSLNVASDSREWIVGITGRGGTRADQLAKGDAQNLYGKNVHFATQVKALADDPGPDLDNPLPPRSIGIAKAVIAQGEADVAITPGATWKSTWVTTIANVQIDVQQGIFGRSEPFPVFQFQPGGTNWATDSMNIQNACIELSHEQPRWFLVGPYYHLTDKAGHLDSNGYRAQACKLGEVDTRVNVLGLGWRPVEPIEIIHRGRDGLASFYGIGKLQWRTCYEGSNSGATITPVMRPNKGFSARDDIGPLGITIGSVVFPEGTDATVAFRFDRDPVGDPYLMMCAKTGDNGSGNLADSDPTIAPYNYQYLPERGMFGAADIPDLVGKPYPMNNFSVAFAAKSTEVL